MLTGCQCLSSYSLTFHFFSYYFLLLSAVQAYFRRKVQRVKTDHSGFVHRKIFPVLVIAIFCQRQEMSFFFSCWSVIGEVNGWRKWGWGLYSLQIGFQFSFVLSSWPQNTGSPFFFLKQTPTDTRTGFFFLSLKIYGHLQSGCGFCKHNLLRLPRSVSSMHQQPC